jgi:hypothetical protein
MLGACGNSSNDSKLLSPTSAAELRSTLATVEEMVETGNCGAAQGQVTVLEEQVTSLDRVEADLRDALVSGVSRLGRLVTENCQPPTAETGPTGTTGPAETGGATGPEEQQSGEQGNGKKNKDKKKDKKKDKSGAEDGGGQQDEGSSGDESGGSGNGGSGGSGGFAP